MKKAMVMLVAVAFGYMANAAVCSWVVSETVSSSNLNAGYVGGEQKYANLSGYTCYLILASDWSSSATADILTSDSVVSKHAFTTDIATWSPTATEGKYQFKVTVEGAIDANVAVGAYDVVLVMSDGTHYFADTAAQTIDVANDLSSPTLQAPEFKYTATNSDLWLASDMGTFAIPEPTSGLLILIGMGAMALRRRRA